MIAQAFFYNAIFFAFALVLTDFYGIASSEVGWYVLPFAAGNFLGPLLLGPTPSGRINRTASGRHSVGRELLLGLRDLSLLGLEFPGLIVKPLPILGDARLIRVHDERALWRRGLSRALRARGARQGERGYHDERDSRDHHCLRIPGQNALRLWRAVLDCTLLVVVV